MVIYLNCLMEAFLMSTDNIIMFWWEKGGRLPALVAQFDACPTGDQEVAGLPWPD